MQIITKILKKIKKNIKIPKIKLYFKLNFLFFV